MAIFEELSVNEYDCIIPIGTDCASATVLEKQRKRKIKNSLLDITVTCSSLDYKFDVLTKPFKPLKIENLSERLLNHKTPDRLVHDSSRDCIIRHRFSQEKHVLDELQFFNDKFKIESEKILSYIESSKRILEDRELYQGMSSAAYARYLSELNSKKMTEQTEELYRELYREYVSGSVGLTS